MAIEDGTPAIPNVTFYDGQLIIDRSDGWYVDPLFSRTIRDIVWPLVRDNASEYTVEDKVRELLRAGVRDGVVRRT